MKRWFALITALLCILLLVPSAALATETEIPTGIGLPENTVTYEAFDTPMTDVPEYRFVDPEKANQATRAGSGYLYSKYVYDSHKTVTHNSKSVINDQFIISVAKGEVVKTTYSVTTTGTIGFTGTPSTALKNALKNTTGANASFGISFTVKKSTEYTFPKDETGNTVSFYIATGFDLKRYYYKKYDVYQGSSAGLGAGLRQELVGTEAVLAHVPHRVEYSVSSTVG